ncbi:ACS family glucarate transporter-like MFS transporter [Caulobacter rhizosphaerae]|jgi:ACS family glucarate transporter-like MFS transporter|uniref:ACS family glucarate transporter-like MFS transporter n=1 Tax=Caulobacter rhizosphaerae TaxID=2010972 RepID=A0ABU1N455_9CAUL|nr:MFS transporter [Caulobacter rhizosphaerae]MDR6532871.1 ACS family glucarate transporter-like MFS transporter [Caulobacter rhizosphaerae]
MSAQNADGAARRTRVRWLIILLLFIITTINYADRATFSIAGQSASKELGLDPVAMGYILSAFAWAYVLGQIPGGILLDRFGSKKIYTIALVTWSFFTALQGLAGIFTGLAAAVALFAMRFMVGVAEAPSFPANSRIVAAWFPGSERGTASAIFNAAQYFALVAFAPLMGWLVHQFGWHSVFFVMGAVGLVAAVVFVKFVHAPTEHPAINTAEFDYIEAGGGLVRMEDKAASNGAAFTWPNVRQVLTSRMLLGVYLGQYCINVLTYFFVTWFPIYLVKERGLSILQAGFTAAAPALCGFVGGLLGGIISDRLLKKTGSLDIARKTPLLVGMLLASLIIACNYVEQEWLVIVIMAVAFFGKGVASLGWAVVADTSPKEMAGVTGGIFNTFGNIAGIVTPIVIGYIVKGTGSFDGALIFVGVHCLITIAAYFLIVGKIQRLVLKPAA